VAEGVDPEFKPQYCKTKQYKIVGTVFLQSMGVELLLSSLVIVKGAVGEREEAA
jgi:hypothetical protein